MDVFAAALQVGPTGSVTGVDVTPEQLAKAERLMATSEYFRSGRIEALPFEDGSFDVVISNGVINLASDKRRCFRRPPACSAPADARAGRHPHRTADRSHRRPGRSWAACIAGASQVDDYLADIAAAR